MLCFYSSRASISKQRIIQIFERFLLLINYIKLIRIITCIDTHIALQKLTTTKVMAVSHCWRVKLTRILTDFCFNFQLIVYELFESLHFETEIVVEHMIQLGYNHRENWVRKTSLKASLPENINICSKFWNILYNQGVINKSCEYGLWNRERG